MQLKDFIQTILNELSNKLEYGITFELGLENDGKIINQDSKNRIKFSIKNKK